jgi:hypothetical protein
VRRHDAALDTADKSGAVAPHSKALRAPIAAFRSLDLAGGDSCVVGQGAIRSLRAKLFDTTKQCDYEMKNHSLQ